MKYKLRTEPATNYHKLLKIGQDPVYYREENVRTTLDYYLPEHWRSRLTQVEYDSSGDQYAWYYDDSGYVAYEALDELEQAEAERQLKGYKAAIESILDKLPHDMRLACLKLGEKLDKHNVLYKAGKAIFFAWGMEVDNNRYDPTGVITGLTDVSFSIQFDLGQGAMVDLEGAPAKYKRRRGYVLQRKDVPTLKLKPHYQFVAWSPEPQGCVVDKNITFTAMYNCAPSEASDVVEAQGASAKEFCNVYFSAESGLSLQHYGPISVERGSVLKSTDLPSVDFVHEGYEFEGWCVAADYPIDEDCTLTALSKLKMIPYSFDAGRLGIVSGTSHGVLPYGTMLSQEHVPSVTAQKGYQFVGWDSEPLGMRLTHAQHFSACYEPEGLPWYKRFWTWLLALFSTGCLRWLWWALAMLLLLLFFGWILKDCSGIDADLGLRSCQREAFVDSLDGSVISDEDIDVIETPTGDTIDDNRNANLDDVFRDGEAPSIIGDDGGLPVEDITAPIVGGDGSRAPIDSGSEGEKVIGNRLNVFFEEEAVDLNRFARDFKQVYPGEEYRIIGVDHNIPMVQIQMPANRRSELREALPKKLQAQPIFVIDDAVMDGGHLKQMSSVPPGLYGWHLSSVQASDAWQVTKGSPEIKIAVLDDGVEARHPMFAGKKLQGYNVFRKDNILSVGVGHGTHVAGIAAGNHHALNRGAAGIAPDCSLMVVQVFDNRMCTTSSVVAGLMYALNHGADVVNLSLGMDCSFAQAFSLEGQRAISQAEFKQTEQVWRKVMSICEKRQAIIVFAAGNDAVISTIEPMHRTKLGITVAAYAPDERLTDFTNMLDGTHIAAPGLGIYSAGLGGTYVVQDGTSMAAPIVAGAVALMKSLKPQVTVQEIVEVLRATSYDLRWNNTDGTYGITSNLRIADALKALMQSGSQSKSQRAN